MHPRSHPFWSLARRSRATSTALNPASVGIPVSPGLRKAHREEVTSRAHTASRWQDLAFTSLAEHAGCGRELPPAQKP